MAVVNFKKGLRANMPASYQAGTFLVATDERAIYLDISDSERIRIGDFQEFATLAALNANPNPSTTALYYVAEVNCLAKWNGTEYTKINLDTGATSFEVVGDGNVITAVAYDAATRKLTLTKGLTAMTAGDVDAKIVTAIGDMTDYDNVKAYVDKKTEGIATDAALGELQGKVTDAEKDIDALEEKVGEKAVGTQIDEKIAALKLGETYEPIGTGATEAGKVQSALDEEIERAKAAEEAAAGAAATADGKAVAAQNAVDALAGRVGTVAEDKTVVGMISEAQAAAEAKATEAKTAADAKVASVAAGDASVTVGGTATAPTVAAKISQDADNALSLAADGLKVVVPAAAEYTIVKAENSGDYAAIYNLTKNGEVVGASINIPKDMVVESGAVVENPDGQPAGTYIKLVLQNVAEPLYINVGSLIEYVTSGSAAGDMVVIAVSDDHRVTASITDGSITLAKLTTEVQTAIGKAHTHENADVLAGINADKVAAWDASEQNAKDHADGLNTAMDTRVKVLEGINHDAYKAADEATLAAAKTYAEEQAAAAKTHAETKAGEAETAAKSYADEKAAAAEKNAKDYADGLAGNYDASGAAATAEQNAKDYADGLAGNYDAAGSAAAAQTAAEATAAAALTQALTWGEF